MSKPILTLDYGDFGKINNTNKNQTSRAFKKIMLNLSSRPSQDTRLISSDYEKNEEKMFYDCIKKIPICVLPDPRIKALNNMPFFSILQGDFRSKGSSSNNPANLTIRQKRKSMREIEPMLGLNTDFSTLKSIDFFKHLNTEAILKLKLKYRKSKSILCKHQTGRYVNLSADMGQKEETEVVK